jgi:hypothetical protein
MIATGFLGYVLPFGQMSLWGATVITNLMSAIPWVGQDIVESENTNIYFLNILPVLGTIHSNVLKKIKTLPDIKEYTAIPPAFLAFFVGLVDGDGYIQITKTTKGFIAMKLVISLHLEDISTLNYIHSVLKLGIINTYKDNRSPTCKLVINKTELQQILFPLLLHHNIFFLTETRIKQFNLAIHILKNDIKEFDLIGSKIPSVFIIPETPEGYLELSYLKN